jgi:hypothetical protein
MKKVSRSGEKVETHSGSVATLKNSTVGTTVYLLPEESWRVKTLAVQLKVSVHELLLMGLDKLLAENNQPAIRRYEGGKERRETKCK